MNTEKLHHVLIAVREEIESTSLLTQMKSLLDHLQNVINQPQTPTHQQNLSDVLTALQDILQDSDYNNFSPGWKQIIYEIGGEGLLGIELGSRLTSIFNRNQITPSVALEEIKTIVDSINGFSTAVDETLSGFDKLKIGWDQLKEGECEIGYIIPRNFTENRLDSLNKEIHEFEFILNNISQILIGEKQKFEVKTISSSDFMIYIVGGIVIAEFLAKAVDRILSCYQRILDIRKLKNELNEKGIPQTSTRSIEKHANNLMEREIKKIAKETMRRSSEKDINRKNELENGLTISLNKIANRMDRGFHIDIRVEPLPEPEEGEKRTKELIRKTEMIESIQESSKEMGFVKVEGKPILKLPETEPKKGDRGVK